MSLKPSRFSNLGIISSIGKLKSLEKRSLVLETILKWSSSVVTISWYLLSWKLSTDIPSSE